MGSETCSIISASSLKPRTSHRKYFSSSTIDSFLKMSCVTTSVWRVSDVTRAREIESNERQQMNMDEIDTCAQNICFTSILHVIDFIRFFFNFSVVGGCNTTVILIFGQLSEKHKHKTVDNHAMPLNSRAIILFIGSKQKPWTVACADY